jgi:hypothetical protein
MLMRWGVFCLFFVPTLVLRVLVPINNIGFSYRMPKKIYQAKKTVAELGLSSMKIECCPKGCMLYYKENAALQSCKICGEERYRIL